MASYRWNQLLLYYNRIRIPPHQLSGPRLLTLSNLMQHQLVNVPVENRSLYDMVDSPVDLHYLRLYTRIVGSRRGGNSFELNMFFRFILQSLDYQVMSVRCDNVDNGEELLLKGPSHMALIVTIGHQRYLVDVGFGSHGPSVPIPLIHGIILQGYPGKQLRLDWREIQDLQGKRHMWFYSQRESWTGAWKDVYSFEVVACELDELEAVNSHAIVNGYLGGPVSLHRFLFTNTVPQRIHGAIWLLHDQVLLSNVAGTRIIEQFSTEAERISAIRGHFGIYLFSDEQQTLRGGIHQLGAVVEGGEPEELRLEEIFD